MSPVSALNHRLANELSGCEVQERRVIHNDKNCRIFILMKKNWDLWHPSVEWELHEEEELLAPFHQRHMQHVCSFTPTWVHHCDGVTGRVKLRERRKQREMDRSLSPTRYIFISDDGHSNRSGTVPGGPFGSTMVGVQEKATAHHGQCLEETSCGIYLHGTVSANE